MRRDLGYSTRWTAVRASKACVGWRPTPILNLNCCLLTSAHTIRSHDLRAHALHAHALLGNDRLMVWWTDHPVLFNLTIGEILAICRHFERIFELTALEHGRPLPLLVGQLESKLRALLRRVIIFGQKLVE